MNFEIRAIFCRSVTIELDRDVPYCGEPVTVLLNGEEVLRDERNVLSLQGLQPDTEYALTVRCEGQEQTKTFRTKWESVLLDVRTFGAKGDGISNDTAALQAAIYACPQYGTVRVPKGVYFTLPLFLKSECTLLLDEGAVLLGDPDRNHYPILPGMVQGTDEKSEYNFGTWEGNPLDSFASLITGIGLHDVDIIGSGVIDGNAEAGDWWENAKVRRIAWRPNAVFIAHSENVRMQGVTVRNSPCWTVHPYYCDHISFYNLTIWNPSDSPNTDGFDPESCRDVLLLGTKISVGDDCVAIKSGKLYMSRYHFVRTDGVEIRNCLFERGHGSVTVGSEVAGGVENVHITRCIFDGTDRGVRIKTRRGRGDRSYLGGLVFEKIRMNRVHMAMTVNMFYFCDPDGHSDYVQDQEPHPVDDRTPVIGPIVIRDVTVTGADASFVCAYGLPERPIEKIELENISVEFLPEEERTPQVPVMMDNFPKLSGRSIYLRNVKEVILKDLTIAGAADTEPELIGVESIRTENLQYR